MGAAGALVSYCETAPWCLSSGPAAFCACKVAVRASILRSSSATRLSAFFWRFLVGGVVMLENVSRRLIHSTRRIRTRRGQPWRIVCRTHARGRLKSPGDFAEPGVSWVLCTHVSGGLCVRGTREHTRRGRHRLGRLGRARCWDRLAKAARVRDRGCY
jgi:hypothetical protein